MTTARSVHMPGSCKYPSGKVLIESITVRTKTGCSDCSNEGVTLSLLGEKNGNYLDGVPCATRTLDHSGTTDYDGSNGSRARFDGTLGGSENDAERTMMGGCYQVGPIYTMRVGFKHTTSGMAISWCGKVLGPGLHVTSA